MEKSKKLKLELKPNVNVAILPTIIYSFVTSIIYGFIASVIINTIMIFFRPSSETRYSLVSFSTVIIILIFLFVITFFRIMNLRSRKYLFYDKEAVFYEGFLRIVQRTVPYSRVTDVILIRGVWDRIFGTGTIELITAGHQGTAGGGVIMDFLENPDDVHKKVKNVVIKKSK